MENKKSFSFRSSAGSVIYCIIIFTIVHVILHNDFWNWGSNQTYYFGWMTGEFLWRLILMFIITPISYLSIVKIAWPKEKKEKGDNK